MTRILPLLAALLLSSPALAEGAPKQSIGVAEAQGTLDTSLGFPVVNLRWTEEGRRLFAKFTADHIGKRIDVMIEDVVVTSPFVMMPLEMAAIQITGLETLAEAEDIARRLTDKKARVFVRLTDEDE